MLEAVYQYLWIAFFVAAAVVARSPRGNVFLVLGLLIYGTLDLSFALYEWRLLDREFLFEYRTARQVLGVAATLMTVAGVIRMASADGAPGDRPPTGTVTDQITLFTPRNDTNTFSRGGQVRDEACDLLIARARAEGLAVVEQRSEPHSTGVWFRIDYSLPTRNPNVSLAASVAATVQRYDFHRFEHLIDLTVTVGSETRTVTGLIGLSRSDAARVHQFIVTPGASLRLGNRIRQWVWQLWRPRNTIRRLRPDWVKIWLGGLAVLLTLIPFIGVLLAIGVVLGLYIRGRGRRTHVLTSGKPFTDPRSLIWMDSWQASVGGLGGSADAVRSGVASRLKGGGPDGATVGFETIGYWGTDSWVEREQMVVRHRRAIGYVHIVPYGDVLYVGWESHLNVAAWAERKLAVGVDRVTGLDVVANQVVAGTHRLNEYDLSDANFLAEWIHEAVKREVKLRMAERKIDQELDFTVQRESRKDALTESAEQARAADKTKKGRFFRIG